MLLGGLQSCLPPPHGARLLHEELFGIAESHPFSREVVPSAAEGQGRGWSGDTRTVDSCCGSRALPQQMASLSTARRARRVGTLLLETHGVRHAHCALQSSHPDPDRSHQRQPDLPISLTLMQGSVHASVLCQ